MKILLFGIEYYPILGGGGSYVANLAKGLAREGVKVVLITSGGADQILQIEKNLVIKRFLLLRELYLGKADIVQAVNLLINQIKEEKPTVMNTHHSLPSLMGEMANLHFGLPHFVTHHKTPSYSEEMPRENGKWSLYGFVNRISDIAGQIVPSLAFKRGLLQGGVDEKLIEQIYPGVDEKVFYRFSSDGELESLMRKLKIGKEDRLILAPTLIRKRKGLEFLAAAIAKLVKKKDPRIKLLITGLPQSNEEEEIISRVKGKLPEGVLVKHEVFTEDEMPVLYNLASVTVLASEGEGLGISLLEAIACGCPVIGTNVMGINEIIEDGVNGRLIKYGDGEGLVGAVTELLKDTEKRQQMIDGAYKTISSKFSLTNQAKKHRKLFESFSACQKFSAGGVLYRRKGGVLEVYLMRHKDYGLVLPKGGKKPGETWMESATREVREETGYEVDWPNCDLGEIRYTFSKDGIDWDKRVKFYGFLVGDTTRQNEQALENGENLEEGVWLSLTEALKQASFDNEKEKIAKLGELASHFTA